MMSARKGVKVVDLEGFVGSYFNSGIGIENEIGDDLHLIIDYVRLNGESVLELLRCYSIVHFKRWLELVEKVLVGLGAYSKNGYMEYSQDGLLVDKIDNSAVRFMRINFTYRGYITIDYGKRITASYCDNDTWETTYDIDEQTVKKLIC